MSLAVTQAISKDNCLGATWKEILNPREGMDPPKMRLWGVT